MASDSAANGLAGAANPVANGQAVPALGLVVFAVAGKIHCNSEAMQHFGRGQWKERVVKGTVKGRTNRMWAVEWDLPWTGGSKITREYGGAWLKNNAKLRDPSVAAHDDGLRESGVRDSSSSGSSDSSSASSSDENEDGESSFRSSAARLASRSLDFASDGNGAAGAMDGSGGAVAAAAAAQSTGSGVGREGQSPLRQFPRRAPLATARYWFITHIQDNT